MRIISWNINGFRSTNNKDLFTPILDLNPDIICLQEIKLNDEIILADGYNTYYNFANKKGYSGVAILTKEKPLKIQTKVGIKRFDDEGRFLLLEFKSYILINLYIPQGGRNKENLSYKLESIDLIIDTIKKISDKEIIICTDFNIAHTNLDVLKYKDNYNNIMFTEEERYRIDQLLNLGLIDSFRINSKDENTFSWWANAFKCRARNIGWRIDYIFISKCLYSKLIETKYLKDYYGSDHCPVMMKIK